MTMSADLSAIAATVAEYKRLVMAALFIAEKAPYWSDVPEDGPLALTITGDTARLYWATCEGGYDDACSLEISNVEFPARLLLMSEAQAKAWRATEMRKHAREEKRSREAEAKRIAEQQERADRTIYARLKAKFEP